MKSQDVSIVIAAYGAIGVHAIETLFALGYLPRQISLWTYPSDDRNSPLRDFAVSHEIELKDYAANSKEALNWLQEKNPDAIFSLHFRDRIPSSVLEIPRLGAINLHPSLLPEYKGCFSCPWAIINGETETGFTYHFMVHEFDAGNVLLQKKVHITEGETAFSLFHKLVVEGIKSFDDVVIRVMDCNELGVPQHQGGSYYPRKLPFSGRIDPNWPEERVERFIRGMFFPPLKGAVLEVNGVDIEVNTYAEYRKLIEGSK